MSGATLSSPLSISNAHAAFCEANNLPLSDSLVMDANHMVDSSDMMEEKGLKKDEDSFQDLPQSCVDESDSSQEAILFCAHCRFSSNSASDMKDHRWQMHPLLTRHKQHLMTSPTGSRKRPNSESSEDKKLSDGEDIAPTNKFPALETAHSSHLSSLSPPRLGGDHVRRTLSSDEIPKLKRKWKEPSRHRKSASVGDLPALRKAEASKTESSRSARISLIDSIATTPLAALYSQHIDDCITNLMKPASSSSDVISSSFGYHHGNHLSTATQGQTSNVFPGSKPTGNLHTLAKAALSGGLLQPGYYGLSRDEARSQPCASLPTAPGASSARLNSAGTMANNYFTGNGVPLKGEYLAGNKLSQGYMATLTSGADNFVTETSPPYLQRPSTGLLPHIIPGFLPQPPNENSLYSGNHILLDPSKFFTSLVPNYFTASMYPGVNIPMCIPSQAFLCGSTQLDNNNNHRNIQNNKFSTLTDVASRLLAEDSRDRCHEESVNFPRASSSSCVRSSEDHVNDAENLTSRLTKVPVSSSSVKVTSDPIQTPFVFPRASSDSKSLPEHVEPNSFSQPRIQPRQPSPPADFSPVAPTSPSLTPQRDNHHISSSAPSRSYNGMQVMDDERVRSLEEALARIDCCDPNERSSILPFRCPDGKWRMVRTKRIGGAWLVQMPGTDTPSVYLPPKKNCGEPGKTLDDWLKDKLAACSKPVPKPSPVHAEAKKVSSQESKRPRSSARGSNPGFGRFTSPIEKVVPTDAIRSLLLRKTAIA